MTPQLYFNLALLLVAVSLGMFIFMMAYHNKTKSEFSRLHETIKKSLGDIDSSLNGIKRHTYLTSCLPHRYYIFKTKRFVDVYAAYKAFDGGLESKYPIKRFPVTEETPLDYCEREAEYLLSTLNEK